MEQVLKNFRLKCSLKDIKTGADMGLKEIIIQGYYGNDAVYRFKDKLRQEGLYELGESYSYFEIGPVK